MKKIAPQICPVIANRKLDKRGSYFRLTLAGFYSSVDIRPGQFVHIKVAESLDPYFRRAFSVAGYDRKKKEIEIIYKAVGRGTTFLSTLRRDDRLDLLGPLGKGFSNIPRSKTVLIAAGGVGLPPLYFLARCLIGKRHDPRKILFFYGGRAREDLVELTRIRKLGVEFIPCTDDGSYGFSGLITEAIIRHLPLLKIKNTVILGCGPEPMLRVLQDMAKTHNLSGELSLEAPMPCGIGVCLGCIKPSLKNPDRYVRVCYDGPVFKIGEVVI